MERILLIDFGSTYTKVTAVDLKEARLLGTASSYTTVQTDINEGLNNALRLLFDKTGKIQFDRRFACSSAAGGLKMISCGLVPELTAEAARMASLGAGAKVMKVYSYQLTEEDAEEILRLSPDIFLLTGGRRKSRYHYRERQNHSGNSPRLSRGNRRQSKCRRRMPKNTGKLRKADGRLQQRNAQVQ